MTIAALLVDSLIQHRVTDIFGIPGGVILDFLYAQNKRCKEIQSHLLFNEQDAAYAAVGYAQSCQRLGVAFATKGPGILNMTTTITDAYHDSIPLLIVTSHSVPYSSSRLRVVENQEINLQRIFKSITKKVVTIEDELFAKDMIDDAINITMENRQGPVIIDVYSKLWTRELKSEHYSIDTTINAIEEYFNKALRPVIMVGDGVRQAEMGDVICAVAEKYSIPVLSSRGSQDILSGSNMYFGYIGSHGVRYANIILSKADVVLSLGNRLDFPRNSSSFGNIFSEKKLIRIDIDKNEFNRKVPNSFDCVADLRKFRDFFSKRWVPSIPEEWIKVCEFVRRTLWDCDTDEPVDSIANLMKRLSFAKIIVSDVGNNEFWVSRAYVYAKMVHKVMYSRSFGVLGNSLGKAIGAYYSVREPVLCFCGDQGIQYNLSELQFIGSNNLPIWVIIINNHASGMIKTRQKQKYGGQYLLTTETTGYSVVDFAKVANTYGIAYHQVSIGEILPEIKKDDYMMPHIIELVVPSEIELQPYLPIGNEIYDMAPSIDSITLKKIISL